MYSEYKRKACYMPLSTLNKVPIGTTVTVHSIDSTLVSANRLKDLGFVKNAVVTPLFRSPLSNTKAFYIKGTIIALRHEDSQKINVITII